MKNIKGCRVYFRHGKTTKAGTVARFEKATNLNPKRVMVAADKPIGGEYIFSLLLIDLRIVPKKIPRAWQKVLRYNEGVKGLKDVGVCYDPWCGGEATTLFNLKTLELLKSHLTETSFSRICLWKEKSIPSEGKLDILDSETVYSVGPVEIQIEDIEHY